MFCETILDPLGSCATFSSDFMTLKSTALRFATNSDLPAPST